MSAGKSTQRRRSREAAFNVLFSHHFTGAPLPMAVTGIEASSVIEGIGETRARLAEFISASEAAIRAVDKALAAFRESMKEQKPHTAKRTGEGVLKDRRWVVEQRQAARESLQNALKLLQRSDETFDADGFTNRLLTTFENNAEQIDAALAAALKGWSQDRITAADGAILRLGIVELLHFPDVPPKVVINEYIELAREYGGDDSHKLVNAVLDRVSRENSRRSSGE